MSALTKLFVILHVVLSMLLVAGLVVYVNQSDNYTTVNKDLSAKLTAAEAHAARADSENVALQSARQQVQLAASGRIQALQNDLTAARQEITGRDSKVAEATAQVATTAGALQSANQAIQLSQGTIDTLQKQLTDLRKTSDQLQDRNSGLDVALNDSNAKLQVTERQRRDLAEQLATAQEQLADKRAGGQASAAPASGAMNRGGRQASEPIVGVITNRRVISGVQYADINLGSSEGVSKNMQFYIVDRQGNYLGKLTVANVQSSVSTGRLEGDRVNEVAAGNTVRTQL